MAVAAFVASARALSGRIALLLVAGATAMWGLDAVTKRIRVGTDLAGVTTRILQDSLYNLDWLQRLHARHAAYSSCPTAAFAQAIIQLRIYEHSADQQTGAIIPAEKETLERDIAHAVLCNPNEPFFPMVSAALALNDGKNDLFVKELTRSYTKGPYENWIALRRSPFALARFTMLPEPLKARVLSEFTNLINSGLHREAAEIFDIADTQAQAALLDDLQKNGVPSLRSAFLTRLIERRAGPRPRSKRSRRLIETFSLPSGTSLQRID